MAGTILENLSTKKISILVALLLVCQAISFLIGGLIAPVPAGNQNIQAVLCKDLPGSHNSTNVWIYSRGKGACKPVILLSNEDEEYTMVNQIVFVFQIPIPRGGYILDYSRWQQNLIGVVHFDNNHLKDPDAVVTIDARLAYRNKGDADEDWKLLAASVERRFLNCHLLDPKNDDQLYSCDTIPLFELGSLHHDYYLLNVRFPVDSDLKMNLDVGRIEDLQLTTIYQNGGFTKVWLSLKTIFFPIVVAVLIWFWHRVHILQRSPALIEYMLVGLGSALTFLNIPLEYLTLWFDMPVMLLLSDIRQGVFYATLLSFWLVFSGEHMLIQENGKRSTVKNYWKHLSAVVVGCISLFAFDLCERGMQLRNPFYSIWASRIGTNLAMTFIVLAGISAGIYFLFLCYMIWKVFRNISMKQSSLPSMSAARRIHYEGIIYRFKFLMLATVICAALTVIGFMMEQAAEGHWKWDEDIEVQLTSAFLTGVYGMWNIYILALIILYAPSHKQWPNDTNSSTERIASEEIEFNNLPSDSNPSEISSLTSFSRKAAFD